MKEIKDTLQWILCVLCIIAANTCHRSHASSSNERLKRNQQVVNGVKCKDHKIYCQIVKNKPKINKAYAMRLSNIIYKKSNKFQIDSRIFTAILMQESGYIAETISCKSGLRETTGKEQEEYLMLCIHAPKVKSQSFSQCASKTPLHITEVVCTDFGIGQIWYKTIKRYDFDVHMLTQDLEYSVNAAALVFADFTKKYKKKEKYYWTRYNASSPKKRAIYRKLVMRYY